MPGASFSFRRMCGWLARLAVFCALLIALGAMPGRAAQEPVRAAGLVIDYGDGRVSYAWVPFLEESITGIELLERSGLSLVSVSFGGLGDGICSIEGTGCGVGECRSRLCQTSDRESPFWQYVRQDKSGEWKAFGLGASQSTVRDGDIDGWAWSGTPPKLPAISMSNIATRVGLDSPASSDGSLPEALVVTSGEAPGNPTAHGGRELLPAAAILACVVGVGSFTVWRTRRHRRRATSPVDPR